MLSGNPLALALSLSPHLPLPPSLPPSSLSPSTALATASLHSRAGFLPHLHLLPLPLSPFTPSHEHTSGLQHPVLRLPNLTLLTPRTRPPPFNQTRTPQSGYDIRLEIDGGVSVANIGSIAEAGVDMFVAGRCVCVCVCVVWRGGCGQRACKWCWKVGLD